MLRGVRKFFACFARALFRTISHLPVRIPASVPEQETTILEMMKWSVGNNISDIFSKGSRKKNFFFSGKKKELQLSLLLLFIALGDTHWAQSNLPLDIKNKNKLSIKKRQKDNHIKRHSDTQMAWARM